MTSDLIIWLLAVSVIASALGGMLGMASGVFIVPILTIWGGLGIHTAIGASLISVIACSTASAAPYLRGLLTNIRLAVVLEVATVLGALTGVFLIGVVPVWMLYLLFAIIMLVSAQQMFVRRVEIAGSTARLPRNPWAAALQLDGSYPDQALGKVIPYRVQQLPLGMGLMYAAGLISALLGIGSGVLKIPAMDSALRLPTLKSLRQHPIS